MLNNSAKRSPITNSPPSPSLVVFPDAMGSQGHSPTDLQNHLYASFVEGRTADVALHIKGSWEAIYKLHRVVLIQAGFFRPMFTAGFSESRFKRLGSRKRGPDEILVVFDDPNITRAAFEVCISRLYGGGPRIHIPPALIPTPLCPLTPSFPLFSSLPLEAVPAGQQLASPYFLLSLLSTAVYLSIPTIAGQALKAVLSTMGPTTVMRYLNFAIGRGIGPPDEGASEAAVGLEIVAEMIKPDDNRNTSDDGSLEGGLQVINIHDEDENEDDYNPKDDLVESEANIGNQRNGESPSCFYGGISNKVGESAACWLARWGNDILPYEEHGGLFTAPSTSKSVSSSNVPTIWARGGLDSSWIRTLLSSDMLFVRGERERYDMARSIIELRRRSGIDLMEEAEFAQLFIQGIHYMHMSMEDLMVISRDKSPTTGNPYVPLSHLRTALWDQSILRHRITTNPSREKDLGISTPTTSLSGVDGSLPGEDHLSKPYFAVPNDSSVRIGDGTGIEGATMDQLLAGSTTDTKRATSVPPSESNYFGILAERQTVLTCCEADRTGNSKWTQYPPFRFGVEFWDIEYLKEKTRMHSHTVWYAGSLFNAYVQIIRKKGVQLGVYLHRQSHIDPLPPSSVPHYRRVEQQLKTHKSSNLSSGSNIIHHSYSLPAIATNPSSTTVDRSTTPTSAPDGPVSPAAVSPHSTSTSPVPYPPQPYRDPRSSISAYFSISCCSATGSLITKLTSGPDVFAISQSWGWKSSSLKPEEYLELGEDGLPAPVTEGVIVGREVSLRATVVIGVV